MNLDGVLFSVVHVSTGFLNSIYWVLGGKPHKNYFLIFLHTFKISFRNRGEYQAIKEKTAGILILSALLITQ